MHCGWGGTPPLYETLRPMAYYRKGRTTPCVRLALRSRALVLYPQCC